MPALNPIARPAPAADPIATALRLTALSPFAMDESGAMRFADPALTEHMLRLRVGALQVADCVSCSEWEARMEARDVRLRRRVVAGLSWTGAQASLDYRVRDGRGERRWVRETLECLDASDNRAQQVHGALRDITAEVEARDRIVWDARHDNATGLPNRDTFGEAATTLGALADRVGASARILRIRLTNLEDLREVYGSEIGDRLLGLVARRLENAVRQPDALGRLKGADFAVGLLGAHVGEGDREPSDRLTALLSDQPYATPFGPLYLDARIVAEPVGTTRASVSDALDRARHRLDGTAHDRAATDSGLGGPRADVLRALDEDRISLAFQPIVDAQTGALRHHECLLRLRGEDGRMVSAGEIIQSAESLGLVHQLDRRALDLAAPHLRADPHTHLALNVSAGTLGHDGHAEGYLAALAELGPLCSRVTVEMTETLAVDDPAQASRFSAAVRALGCRFAIDDFGSGYTTFRNLMAVEADSIKIDGALIRGIATDENKQTFMRMMVDLAHTFSVKTVAEMVETQADADVLRRIGADYLQGYHFGHPAPAPNWSRLNK